MNIVGLLRDYPSVKEVYLKFYNCSIFKREKQYTVELHLVFDEKMDSSKLSPSNKTGRAEITVKIGI